MPSTPTTRLRIEKQQLGSNLNTWGETKLNDCFDRLDEAIAGVQAITISGTSTTLTSTNYATDQARKAALVLTGTLSANSTITVPNVEKLYLVVNNTTMGAFSLTIKTSGGTGYALTAGPQWVYCNGTDVYRATPRLDQLPAATAAVALNSQRLTGLGTPSADTDAATKKYVDDAVFGVTAGSLPGQTGNAGKFLTTDGSAVSWGTPAYPVSSVNSKTGVVTLGADDIAASATRLWFTTTQQTKLSGIASGATANSTDAVLLARANHTGTQATSTITGLDTTLAGLAPLANPALTGTPTAPTATAGTNSTQIATTAFVTTNYAALAANNTFTKAVRGSVQALTDAASIAMDASLGNYFSVTLGGNRTLANPSNLVVGQGGSIIITQDATGSRTLAFGTSWKFAGGTAPTLSTTAGAVDRLDYLVVSGSSIHAALTKDIK